MRPSLSIKMLMRTPVKTLLTFSLLFAVSFALFSRVGAYAITSREFKSAAKEFRGVGSVEISETPQTYPNYAFYINEDSRLQQDATEEYKDYLNTLRYQPLSQDQIMSVLELPYISTSDMRLMTAGVSDKYYRIDDGMGIYNYSARFVLEGTLSSIEYDSQLFVRGNTVNILNLSECKLLAGDPSWIAWMVDGDTIDMLAFSESQNADLPSYSGNRIITSFAEYRYGTDYVKNLNIGERYVIVGRIDTMENPSIYIAGDSATDTWCDAIQSVDGPPENYLETDQFAPLRELIELTNSDIHTFDVVYTDDMSSIMRFVEGKMALESGRALTREDSANKSRICVVNNEFAAQNKLGIGDTVTLKLGAELFEQYKGLGAVASARERYSPPEKTEELEIVGIYSETDGKADQARKPNWSYSVNTVFVPKSLLPLDESLLADHVFSPSEFSFTVDDAWDIPSFIKETMPMITEMGLTSIFNDGGWLKLAKEVELSTKQSIIEIIIALGAMFAAFGLSAYLFIGRKKKEYAIMRVMGTTHIMAASILALPFMAVSLVALLAGIGAAWIHTPLNFANTNTVLSYIEGYAANTYIPVTVAAGCLLVGIIFLPLVTLYAAWRLGATPLLELLQDHTKKQTSNKQLARIETKAIAAVTFPGKFKPYIGCDVDNNTVPNAHAILGTVPLPTSIKTCRHVLRYVAKHIHRSAGISLLSILLSALLFGAVGQFTVIQQSYMDSIKNMEIKAEFVRGLSLSNAIMIEKMDYVSDLYYEFAHYAYSNTSKTDWVITNDVARYTGEKSEIIYANGYNESCMKELGNVCIVGQRLLETNGLTPGDEFFVSMPGYYEYLTSIYIDKYKTEHPDEKLSDDEIVEYYKNQIDNDLKERGIIYTIAGSITTPSNKYENTVFAPGTLKTTSIFGFEVPLDLAEFHLDDNLRAEEFRNYALGIVEKNAEKYRSEHLTFMMDTSRMDELSHALALLDRLFPVVVAVTIIIVGVLSGLIILQSSKQAAILRVLGTTRRQTCIILVSEQVLLCIVGIAVGLCGLLLYNGALLSQVRSTLEFLTQIYITGCFAGTVICSVIATRRNMLELLNTIE